MDPAVAGLIGAVIGALTALGVAFFSSLWQSRREQIQWIRNKREEAYSNAVRALLRFINKRSAVTADGTAYLSQEHIKEWFDDYSDVQQWVAQVSIYCSDEQDRLRINTKSIELKKVFDGLLSGEVRFADSGIIKAALTDSTKEADENEVFVSEIAQELLDVVISSSRKDLIGATRPGHCVARVAGSRSRHLPGLR